MFITSTAQVGDFGGIAGADTVCQNLSRSDSNAPWATSSQSSDWSAFLSTSTKDALDIVSVDDRSLPVFQYESGIGEVLVANTYNEMFGATPTFQSAIGRTESGALVSTSIIYTGSNNDGTASSNTCSDWTTTSGDAARGLAPFTTSFWLSIGTHPCNQTNAPIYCITNKGVDEP